MNTSLYLESLSKIHAKTHRSNKYALIIHNIVLGIVKYLERFLPIPRIVHDGHRPPCRTNKTAFSKQRLLRHWCPSRYEYRVAAGTTKVSSLKEGVQNVSSVKPT